MGQTTRCRRLRCPAWVSHALERPRPCVIRRKDDTMRNAALWSLRGLGPLALAFLVGASSLVPADAARARFSSVPTVDVPMYRGSAAGNAVLTTGQNLTLNWTSPFLGSIVVDAVPYGERLYVGGMVTTPQYTT